MKTTGILTAMIGVGAGFVLGNFAAPQIRHATVAPAPDAIAEQVPAPVAIVKTKPEPVAPTLSDNEVADLAALLQEDNAALRLRALGPYVDSLAPNEVPAVIAQVEAAHGPGRNNLLEVLASRWVDIDPQVALAVARKREIRGTADNIFSAYYGAWAARDPEAAFAAVRKMPDGGERGSASWALLYQIGDSDPAKAQELFAGTHAKYLDNGSHFVFAQWADRKLDEATKVVTQDSSFTSAKGRADAVQGIADHLFENSPQDAVDWFAQLPAGRAHDEAEERIAEQWGGTDPMAALKWLGTLPDSTIRADSIDSVIDKWTKQEPQEALAYAATLADGPQKGALKNRSIGTWARSDGAAAIAWAQAQGESPDKKETLLRVINSWAEVDPAAASAGLKLIPQEIPPLPVPVDSRPPELELDGMDFMMTRPGRSFQYGFNRETDQQAYAALAKNWAGTDPAQAGAWIAQLRPGPCQDAALESYSDQMVGGDPRRAVEIASSMSNAKDMQTQLMNVYMKWMEADPATATSAIQASSLPDKKKQRLLEHYSQKAGL